MQKKILVTGGSGYIGSHTTLALLEAGFDVVVLDNLCNSSIESLNRIENICGKKPDFIEGDVRDEQTLDKIFATNEIDSVLHFAGLKAVGESVNNPLTYYSNNVVGSLTLCKAMVRANVFKLVFSSSATVYGDPIEMPVREDFPTGTPTNPYGRSKLIAEEILQDLAKSDSRWSIALLRYFNPVGAHESGTMGEDPNGIPSNLVPYISQVAIEQLSKLSVYGRDYPTPDGTGVRDYIHVQDLAEGHLSALNAIDEKTGVNIWNLGTGVGYSVLEMIQAFEVACGRSIPYQVVDRRTGDIAECWAAPKKAAEELGWTAKRDLSDMMADTWRWQKRNPTGYKS
ncbi:UDP-glucose 4-epimerase GalE [Pseudomonas sp. FSL R10-1350]|uniref:UDP-glucose 4-epimerase GalE n=1 Tax=Pseudomonas sp. FSL R10-1350 TaxID=2662197 RepID=UPI0012949F32|nr:UDP-glucose 4-epimerase GalE [Pseudomonas sp. FSL R10-1350]MQU62934.1 UDP-glucose 4-epimerase GalE [Pseudomonas sp. FSL R10-1350]